jgi:hypothetical protein
MAANPEATLSTASGIARHVQGKVQDLIPSKDLKFIKRIPYDKENQVGADYAEPVWLTGEHGVTFTGSSGGAVTLNGAEVAESKNAVLNPSALYFQSRAVIDLLARAISMGERAAESYIAALMRNTKKGINKRVEIKTIYGGLPIGTVSSMTDPGAGTTSTITFTDATYASGVWLGSRNMPLAFYSSTTLKNIAADVVVTANQPKTKSIAVSGSNADLVAMYAVGTHGSGLNAYLKSQYGNCGTGVKGISKLASGDTFLGITCANYADVFCATQSTWDSTLAFTWENLQNGLEEAVGRGLESDLVVAVPQHVWATLNGSLDALRVFDSSYSVKSVDMGHDEDAIRYHSMGINMKVEMSTYVMGGDVIAYPDPAQDSDGIRRIGASDVTFNVPGQGEDMFIRVVGTNVCEWMAYTCQDAFTTRPRDFIYWGA